MRNKAYVTLLLLEHCLFKYSDGRRKGGQGVGPLDLKNVTKKGCFISFELVKTNFTTFGIP